MISYLPRSQNWDLGHPALVQLQIVRDLGAADLIDHKVGIADYASLTPLPVTELNPTTSVREPA
jgi:hypothetical protein